MIDTLNILLTTEKTGGLFDIDGTLGLIAVQFLVLMGILNFILYTPLLDILKKRDLYIRNNLKTAGANIIKSNELTTRYQKRLIKFNKVAETHSILWQKKFQALVNVIAQTDQKTINKLTLEVEENLDLLRNITLANSENEIDLLSDEIVAKVLP